MKPRIQRISLLLAAALMAAGGAQSSWADGRYNGKHSYRAPYYGQHHYYGGGWYRPHNSDDDENLIYGLLVGGLFGYVIGNAQQQGSYAPPAYTPPPETRYEPAPAPPASTCLQEREYQMTVIVGGKEAQAYGTACLQPDGSWYRGPAKVVSQ